MADVAQALTETQHRFVTKYLAFRPVPEADGASAPDAPAEARTNDKGGFVELQKMRLVWDSARKAAIAQTQGLHDEIMKIYANAPDQSDIAAASQNQFSLFEAIDEKLLDKLDDALNASDADARRRLEGEAGVIARAYLDMLDAHPVAAIIDDNPFRAVPVAAGLRKALSALAARLS